MEDILISLLESLCDKVIRQGSLSPEDEYPDTFMTFWNSGEVEHSAYDNGTKIVEYSFMVNAYSTDPEVTYSLMDQARDLLKDNGWIITSRGYDAVSDEITHTGRGITVAYLKTE
jgi:hypothetical protein